MSLTRAALLAICAALPVMAALPAAAQAANAAHATFFRAGAAKNIEAHPQAGYALIGGGPDLDEAFRWLCGHADGGDMVVLRASGADDYNPYLRKICKLNSVTTIVIPDREAALDPQAAETIRGASAIFFAGGDQAKYTRGWRDTPVEAALRDAIKRGIPVGGTSAGLAIMGEYIYSAEGDQPDDQDLSSEDALTDPFSRQVVISPDLLGIPVLRGVITDSHFDTREREGRMLVFLARILETGKAKEIRGIGVAEETALLVEPDGRGHVVGKGEVEFFDASGKPKMCREGKPLAIRRVLVRRVMKGRSFDLTNWRGQGNIWALSVQPTGGRALVSETLTGSDVAKSK
jgi:cyanophycinase